MQVEMGSQVTMHYVLRLADGRVVESSFDDEPVSFVVGDGSLDKTLELALLGMKAGDEDMVTFSSGQAFGSRDEDASEWMDLDQFSEDLQPEVGLIISFSEDDGEESPGTVVEMDKDRVKVDFNHPLAGREVEFEIKMLAVEIPSANEFSQ